MRRNALEAEEKGTTVWRPRWGGGGSLASAAAHPAQHRPLPSAVATQQQSVVSGSRCARLFLADEPPLHHHLTISRSSTRRRPDAHILKMRCPSSGTLSSSQLASEDGKAWLSLKLCGQASKNTQT